MNRRDFLTTASGVAGGAAATTAAGTTAAQEGSETTTSGEGGTTTAGGNSTTTSGGGGGGSTTTVAVGPDGNFVFSPGTDSPLYITPGTTVEFVWESDTHNIVVDSQPDGANWEGVSEIHNTGFTYEHTFETLGEYEYFCQPHQTSGMVGTIVVNEAGAPASGGGEVDPEHMGVPFQAHYVGIATVLMIIASLIFAFYLLKYGESAHSSAPNK